LLSWHLYNRAIVAWYLGETDIADQLSEESWRLAAPLGDALIPGCAAAGRAGVLRDLGRPAEALELLISRAGGDDLALIAGGWRGVWLEVMTMCHLDLDDVTAATSASARARSTAEAVPVNIAQVSADRSECRVALATGAYRAAVDLAQSALMHAIAMNSPPFVASTHELLGRAYVANGEVRAAAESLESASSMYDELGAPRLRDRVDAELRRLGHTVHRRTRPGDRSGTGATSLTGRELEIAELIGTHATNRQIATELFLSLKTVETHIRNIFNKLGVTSRGEIAAVLSAADASAPRS
jgi:DNA-binding CsgD family transcriptional regulator